MAAKKERNYLFILLGGLFLVAVAVLLAYSSFPLEGCVGVIEVKGPIISDDIGATVFSDEIKGAQSIAGEIEAAGKRSDVKSLLVLIDSPGGSVVASRELYEALRSFNKSKVAYIHELGASGGYYVAAAADYIVASPDAIVGNIGARATFADFSGLFSKLGINETTIKTGAMKDIGSPSRPMTAEERTIVEGIINESFEEFKSAVKSGRGDRLDKKGFETVLDARILSGRQAKKIGLIDELGNKKSALAAAAALGGIKAEEPRTCDLSASGKKSLLGSFSSQLVEFLARSAGVPRLSYQ
jgi:protease-4